MTKSPNLPDAFRKMDGFPMVDVNVRLEPGKKIEVTTREMAVSYGRGSTHGPGSDFVAGGNSLSSKHVYGIAEKHECMDYGKVIKGFAYCAVEDVEACKAVMVQAIKDCYYATLAEHHAEIAKWESCVLEVDHAAT